MYKIQRKWDKLIDDNDKSSVKLNTCHIEYGVTCKDKYIIRYYSYNIINIYVTATRSVSNLLSAME